MKFFLRSFSSYNFRLFFASKNWCSRWKLIRGKKVFSLEKRRTKDCFLLTHNLKNKKVSVRDKISSRCANCSPAVKRGPSLAEVSQAVSVAKSSQYNVLHNGNIWISQFLSSYPVILTFADISYLIEWTYRISHAFFWEWFLPLTWSTVLFRSRAGPPRRSLIRATPEPLVLSHNSIRKIFSWTEMKAPSSRPVVWSPRRPLLQIQWKVFISGHWGKATRPP